MFAKKASAFNSWFENAEEDMTDPVRCNSLEEIFSLKEAHRQFQQSLSSATADFEALAQLDKQIKKKVISHKVNKLQEIHVQSMRACLRAVLSRRVASNRIH